MFLRLLISVFTIICVCTGLFAQVKQAEIGVDGLTCSQCTRSTEISIRKLDFVADIVMDLEHTNGIITFKEGAAVYFEQIARAVVDAGFSVRYMKVALDFGNTQVSDGYCYKNEGVYYRFEKGDEQTLKGLQLITIIGDAYLPKKEAKKWQGKLSDSCGEGKERTYHVTL